MISKIVSKAQRAWQLGALRTAQCGARRVQNALSTFYLRQIANGFLSINNSPIELLDFVARKKQCDPAWFVAIDVPVATEVVLADAQKFTRNEFDLLGSGSQIFEQMPWHVDFRLRAQNPDADCNFDPATFYKDIKITVGQTDQLEKDIKVPWELSRFYHAPVLGRAYKITGQSLYANVFVAHVTDWIDKNPFMLGVNWVCPMEVGLRAFNWIIAFEYFKQCPTISDDFWQMFVLSLYQHLWYLERNWEIYDGRTSNHYLSNLLGYYYLTDFFQLPEKKEWCQQEIMREFQKQVSSDGTSYEQSTAYHRLVTELFYYCFLLRGQFPERFWKMVEFIDWCTISENNYITIGDDDSGRILWYRPNMVGNKTTTGLKCWTDFGITIIKKKNIHLSIRHHAHNSRQPSGHAHNDVGSITLTVDGIPVFIDPGSYIYTPSAYWRNTFRSATAHNTFFIKNEEPVPFDERLFALNVSEKKDDARIDESTTIETSHDLYARFGLHAQRIVSLQENKVQLCDSWHPLEIGPRKNRISCWNFMLASDIHAERKNNCWELSRDGKLLVYFDAPSLPFSLKPCWSSLHYGKKVPTHALYAQTDLALGTNYTITFTV